MYYVSYNPRGRANVSFTEPDKITRFASPNLYNYSVSPKSFLDSRKIITNVTNGSRAHYVVNQQPKYQKSTKSSVPPVLNTNLKKKKVSPVVEKTRHEIYNSFLKSELVQKNGFKKAEDGVIERELKNLKLVDNKVSPNGTPPQSLSSQNPEKPVLDRRFWLNQVPAPCKDGTNSANGLENREIPSSQITPHNTKAPSNHDLSFHCDMNSQIKSSPVSIQSFTRAFNESISSSATNSHHPNCSKIYISTTTSSINSVCCVSSSHTPSHSKHASESPFSGFLSHRQSLVKSHASRTNDVSHLKEGSSLHSQFSTKWEIHEESPPLDIYARQPCQTFPASGNGQCEMEHLSSPVQSRSSNKKNSDEHPPHFHNKSIKSLPGNSIRHSLVLKESPTSDATLSHPCTKSIADFNSSTNTKGSEFINELNTVRASQIPSYLHASILLFGYDSSRYRYQSSSPHAHDVRGQLQSKQHDQLSTHPNNESGDALLALIDNKNTYRKISKAFEKDELDSVMTNKTLLPENVTSSSAVDIDIHFTSEKLTTSNGHSLEVDTGYKHSSVDKSSCDISSSSPYSPQDNLYSDNFDVVHDGHFYICEMSKVEKEFSAEIILMQMDLANSESISKMTDEIEGQLRATVGKAKLLIEDKFRQFRRLCTQNIEKNEGKVSGDCLPIHNSDLEGFWAMILIQVDDLRHMFHDISRLRELQWKPPIPDSQNETSQNSIPKRRTKSQINQRMKNSPNVINSPDSVDSNTKEKFCHSKDKERDIKRSAEAKKRLQAIKRAALERRQMEQTENQIHDENM